MMAARPKVSPIEVRELSTAEDSASAVTMPGSAIGSTRMNDTASRPKNANRCTANEASVPSTSAMHVAHTAATIDVHSALCRFESCHATWNHFKVKSWGGHAPDTLLLNA